jgi:Rab-GTPase-TBC domain
VVALCGLFEDLLVHLAPRLVDHMRSVGCPPLDVAFPWLRSAFSTYLEIPQLLLLWDRVIGYDSLDVLALLAVAILVFRYNSITSADSAEVIRCVVCCVLVLRILPSIR